MDEQMRMPEAEFVPVLIDALLPSEIPAVPGLSCCARYLLAEPARAGGDWIDLVTMPDGRVALIAGDVVGHGVEATSTMGRLHAVLCERLLSGAPPAEALRSLDRYARTLPEAFGATVCVVALDARDGSLQCFSAGHPPPMIAGPRGTRFLAESTGVPLATERHLAVTDDALGPDESLVLYTDGLVDRPGTSRSASMDALARVASEPVTATTARRSVEVLTDALVHELLGDSGYVDDVTLLVVERVPLPGRLHVRVPAEIASVAGVRARLDEWLDAIGAGMAAHIVLEHALVELMSNAAQHAYPPGVGGTIEVTTDLGPNGTVCLRVVDFGSWQRSRLRPGQRGLALTGGLVDRLQVTSTATGTEVSVEHRVGSPVQVSQVGGHSPASTFSASEQVGLSIAPGRLSVSGALDGVAADALHSALLEASRAGTLATTVDLDAVSVLGSAAVQVLFEFRRRADDNGAAFRAVAGPATPASQALGVVSFPHEAHA